MSGSDASTKDNCFGNCVILAPMVRISKLPMRLLALDYGADFVFTEEIIDRRLMSCSVTRNEALSCFDFREPDHTLVLRIHDREKDKLLVQIGTASSENALKAAKIVENYCFGVDINMGCPKSFSTTGGMGAALLKKPQIVEQILTTLVKNCSVKITCKIRLIPNLEDGLQFMRMIESCGVNAVTVHGRFQSERPKDQVHLDLIKLYAAEVKIPVIANGLAGTRESLGEFLTLEKVKNETGCDSLMVARNAMWNCSVFKIIRKLKNLQSEHFSVSTVDEKTQVAKKLLKYCVTFDFPVQYFKYAVQNSIGDHPIVDKVRNTTLMSEVCAQFDLEEFYRSELLKISLTMESPLQKKPKLEPNGIEDDRNVIMFSYPFEYNKYRKVITVPPKTLLSEFFNKPLFKNCEVKPRFETTPFQDSRWKCVCYLSERRAFLSTYCERNKKHAEQVCYIKALSLIKRLLWIFHAVVIGSLMG